MDRMRSVEIQARSTDEAIRLALEQLGATRNEVEIQVLAETEDDIYGEGEVLIRVSVRGSVAPPRGDRGQSRGGPAREGRPRDARPPRQQSGRQGGGQRRGQVPSSHGVYRPPAADRQRQPSQASDEQTQAVEALAKDVVRDLLTRMDIQADVMAVDNPSVMPVGNDDPLTVFIDVMGRDLGQLIGRRGENLSQFQYMVNLLVNKRNQEWVRVVVDVEGYRTHREESLIGLAERVARQVARNRRPISLDPMPPNERRIVHMTLKSLPDVRTESSGEGDMRRVTIFPQ
jgi:spoIIIJ-associated protein